MDSKTTCITLTPEELAERWGVSINTIYKANNAGKLPHLEIHKGKFPLPAIEEIEKEPGFNPDNIKTPRERRLEREINSKEQFIKSQEVEIQKLKSVIAKIQTISTEFIFNISAKT